MTTHWEWMINGLLILTTLLNLYQAYDWWKTTQKLKDKIEEAEHHRKRYIQLADAYQDFIEHLQKKTGGDHKTPGESRERYI